jgi:glutathione peroxidase
MFGDGLEVLGFPCNQFGHQTNDNDDEFLNTLKYVRPGNGFVPKFKVFRKVHVNGKDASPLFKYMKARAPIPMDPPADPKFPGVENVDALIFPRAGFDSTTIALWSPVTRSDIAWNFEKFLVDQNGNVVKRYSRFYPTLSIADDIARLLGRELPAGFNASASGTCG